MNQVIHPCGTPACVWGHYVARTDLQSDFVADLRCSAQARLVTGPSAGWGLSYNDEKVCKHFGLRVNDVERLFAAPHDECTCDRAADYWYDDDDHEGDCLWHGGCGGATTPEDAAAYIRAFVAKREAEDALR